MSQKQFEAAYRALMAEEDGRQRGGEHPTPEQLAAFHEQRLEGSERDHLRQHLLDCSDCMAIWRGLRGFEEEDPAEAAVPSEFERALFRRTLKARLEEEAAAHAPGGEHQLSNEHAAVRATGSQRRGVPFSAFFPTLFPTPIPMTVAATLLAATLGLSLWNLQLRRDLESSSAPQINLLSHHLTTASSTRSAGNLATPEVLDATRGSFLFITPPPNDRLDLAATTLTIRIFDSSDRSVWHLPANRLDKLGVLTLHLPVGALGRGSYRLELSTDDGSEVLADHLLEVR